MNEKLKKFPVIIKIPVQWGEMDSFGHVNNIIYFRYFENARIQYLVETNMIDELGKKAIGPILAKTSCTFLKPVKYPDTLLVGASTKIIGNSHFIMEYAITNSEDELVAIGDSVIVTYDYNKLQKTPVPESIINAIEKIEGCASGSKCVDQDFDWNGGSTVKKI